MKHIGTFREGMHIADVYLCKNKQIALTKSGKKYGSLVLQNKTGTIGAKIWNLGSPGVGELETMDYVRVGADITLLRSSNQMNIRRIRKTREGEYMEAGYLPVPKRNVQEVYKELLDCIRSIKDRRLQKLLNIYFVDSPAFAKAFQFYSAAKGVRHGFVGGLLEHTLSVTKLCDYYAFYYPQLNRDLLLTVAIFHDIGRTKELSRFPENGYTDDGQLLGHIIIGTEMVSRGVRAIPGFPGVLTLELKRCILTHHKELGYSSPKKPVLLEALALNFADNTNAKMETMIKALSTGNAGSNNKSWLEYNRLLETNIGKASR